MLKQAVESGIQDWIDAEIELLHNLPSLMGEGNKKRHRYFWYKERTHYIEWVSRSGPEKARSRMRTYYEPIWNEMEHLVEEFLRQDGKMEGSPAPWHEQTKESGTDNS